MAPGRYSEAVATSAPERPATFQPIRATSIEPGPGAARDNAKKSANSRSVTQPCTATDCCAMSARTALLPPKDSNDNGANTANRASRMLPSPSRISAARQCEGEADAERRQHQHDRDQRPAQDADA